jgi:hypothetical protein
MRKLNIITEVTIIKTFSYNIEAESLEEAFEMLGDGDFRGEGEEIGEDILWETENIVNTRE